MCPFRNSTVCAADYITSSENPALLDTLIICSGPTRYTPAIPFPLAITTIPTVLENGEFGRLAYRLKREITDTNGIIARFNELEQRFGGEYIANMKEARTLLDKGDRQGFLDMLQKLLDKQVAEAYSLMNDILKEVQPELP